MEKHVSYQKQTLDSPNPIARFSHRRRYAFSLAKTLAQMGPQASVLDFGSGDGTFLNLLAAAKPDAILYGYDPESEPLSGNYQRIGSLDGLEPHSINLICCFETLEHLYPAERERFYLDVKRLLVEGGKVIISVPVIGGPTLLLKELNRMILFRRKSEYSLRELVLAVFWGQPARSLGNPRISHKGFDFREIEAQLISHGFGDLKKTFSPFSFFPWFFNSQIFFVAQ